MSNDVGYEMAWKILKNIIEQLKNHKSMLREALQ